MEKVIAGLILISAVIAAIWSLHKIAKGESNCGCSKNCNICSEIGKDDNG